LPVRALTSKKQTGQISIANDPLKRKKAILLIMPAMEIYALAGKQEIAI
jgi:hypothetical protein